MEDTKMMNYTKEQEKAINDYLVECVKNNYHCQHCAKNHGNVCFFASECFIDNMKYYDDGDDYDPLWRIRYAQGR